jgi:hypothetical protein
MKKAMKKTLPKKISKIKHSYLICEFVKLFGQSYVSESSVTIDFVARPSEIKPFGEIAVANGLSIDHGDVGNFTKGILCWWKRSISEVGAWSKAARITFAMAPNPAGAELVFSLLEILLRSNQDTAFSDYIRGSIILCYNNTKRSHEARK